MSARKEFHSPTGLPPLAAMVDAVRPGVVVLEIAGEADLATRGVLDLALACAFDWSPRLILVDLTSCSFFGSAALRQLLEANLDAIVAGIGFRVACSSRAVRRVLHLTGVDREFTLYHTREEALDGSTLVRPDVGL